MFIPRKYLTEWLNFSLLLVMASINNYDIYNRREFGIKTT